MKRIWALLIAAIYLLGVAGCSDPLRESENSEAPTIQSTTAVTPAATAEPAPSATPGKTRAETAAATAAIPKGPAVICDENGEICGGYLNGKWRTSSEVARYLNDPVRFYSYNLLGKGETVESEGVSSSDGDGENLSSWAKDNPNDESDEVYGLEIDGGGGGDADSYTGYPLEYYLLYNLGPEYLPQIYAVEDTSKEKSAVQSMLDKHFGNGAPEAEIIIAVSADIDADGKRETVVNAANDEDNVYEYYCDKPLYCISCVIEDNGEIVVIDEYYMSPDTAINDYNKYASEHEDESYEKGDDIALYADINFFYVQNIVDLDHDGVCEFVLRWEAWEAWDTTVYKYKDKKMDIVLSYGGGV